jgi:di/tricarboxylate transporter
MALGGRRLLPGHSLEERTMSHRKVEGDLVDIYKLGQRLFRAKVPAGSALIGRSLAQSTLREIYAVNVVAIEHDGRIKPSPPPDTPINEGDVLLLEGSVDDFRRRDVEPYLEILPSRDWRERDLESPEIVVVEVMLKPRSGLIDHTLRESHFREKYGLIVLAVWRGGLQIYSGLPDLPLEFGDSLLVQGPRERLRILRDEPDLIVLAYEDKEPATVPGKGRIAIGIMIATLAMAAIEPELVGEIVLGGALAMMLIGALTMDEAYRAIDWKSVFLVAGMLPMGLAMAKTGAAELLADTLIHLLGASGPVMLVAGLFLLTTLLTQAMNGAAVVAVIAPIAIHTAKQVGLNPRALAMAVALGSSMAFLTPLGHPVNILVMGPGGYTFRDYFKVGLPLSLLLFVVVILLLPVFWPLS